MPTKKARIALCVSVAMLLLALMIPGFCTCSLCLVAGAHPKSCECTILGIYLWRKALRLFDGPAEIGQKIDTADCGER